MERLRHATASAIVGGIGFLVALAMYNEFAPVTVLMQAEQVESESEGETVNLTFLVRGFKIRGCGLVIDSGISWYRDSRGMWVEAGIVEFPNDVGNWNTRPASWFERQSFGLFKLTGIPKDAKRVRATVNHLCGEDPIPRVTENGEWNVMW